MIIVFTLNTIIIKNFVFVKNFIQVEHAGMTLGILSKTKMGCRVAEDAFKRSNSLSLGQALGLK